jgi:hypothetical protein
MQEMRLMRNWNCRLIRHFGFWVTWMGIVLMVEPVSAYHLRCDRVHENESLARPSEVLIQEVQSAMAAYQKLLGINQIKHDAKSLDLLKTRLSQFSSIENEKLKQFVQSHYLNTKLLKYEQAGPFKSFKRHLDLIVSEKTEARRFFRQMIIERQLSVEEALNQYFLLVQEWTRSPTFMKAEDLLLTALRLQDHYLDKETQEQSLKYPLVLYGSFVNGRALVRRSDLDFVVTKPEKEVAIPEGELLKALEFFPFSEAQSHFMPRKSIHTLGFMNPLVVIVAKETIILRVYKNQKSLEIARQPQFDEYYY